MNTVPGGYYVDYDHIAAQSHPEHGQSQSLMPQAHVKRFFNIAVRDYSVDHWNDYINSLGRNNDGIGTVRSLGNMAVTYIDTTQMGRMFSKRFPQCNSVKMLSELNGIAADLKEYIFRQGSTTIELVDTSDDGDGVMKAWLPVDLELDPVLKPVANSRTRRGFEFRPDARRLINEEMRVIRAFFRSAGFDTRNLDRGEPHLTVFEGYFPIGTVAVNQASVIMPEYVSLEIPEMRVMPNRPVAGIRQ